MSFPEAGKDASIYFVCLPYACFEWAMHTSCYVFPLTRSYRMSPWYFLYFFNCWWQGLLTSVWWDGPYFHPREFSADDVNAGLVDDLRVAKPDNKDPKCNAPAALSSAKKLFPSVEGWVPDLQSCGGFLLENSFGSLC